MHPAAVGAPASDLPAQLQLTGPPESNTVPLMVTYSHE